MGLRSETLHVTGYQCESCGKIVQADSAFDADKPEGYFVRIERVTEARNHNRSEELFFDEKDCLIHFFEFGNSAATMPWTPIGVKKRGRGWEPIR